MRIAEGVCIRGNMQQLGMASARWVMREGGCIRGLGSRYKDNESARAALRLARVRVICFYKKIE